jgi:hypothetical protein
LSLKTFEEGKEFLAKVKEINLSPLFTQQQQQQQQQQQFYFIDSSQTSKVCLSIENMLENLNKKRLQLEEEVWKARKTKLKYTIQILQLKEEIKKTFDWIVNEGDPFLEDANLGQNYEEALEHQKCLDQFIKVNYKVRNWKMKYIFKLIFSDTLFTPTFKEHSRQCHALFESR